MALKVIDNDCRVESGKLIIVIEGASPDVVLSNEAKNMALTKAAEFGYTRLGINGQSGSYPVDEYGKEHEDWNEMSKEGKIAAYRNEIKLMGGL